MYKLLPFARLNHDRYFSSNWLTNSMLFPIHSYSLWRAFVLLLYFIPSNEFVFVLVHSHCRTESHISQWSNARAPHSHAVRCGFRIIIANSETRSLHPSTIWCWFFFLISVIICFASKLLVIFFFCHFGFLAKARIFIRDTLIDCTAHKTIKKETVLIAFESYKNFPIRNEIATK